MLGESGHYATSCETGEGVRNCRFGNDDEKQTITKMTDMMGSLISNSSELRSDMCNMMGMATIAKAPRCGPVCRPMIAEELRAATPEQLAYWQHLGTLAALGEDDKLSYAGTVVTIDGQAVGVACCIHGFDPMPRAMRIALDDFAESVGIILDQATKESKVIT